jgi:hypothetical protein
MKKYCLIALILVLILSCKHRISAYKLVDEAIPAGVNYSPGDSLVGLWINTKSLDTITFKKGNMVRFSNKKNGFTYFVHYPDSCNVTRMDLNEMQCDTFYSNKEYFDSIRCKTIKNHQFIIIERNRETIKLNSFIDNNQETILRRINNAR